MAVISIIFNMLCLSIITIHDYITKIQQIVLKVYSYSRP
jgi:hypothetical protein